MTRRRIVRVTQDCFDRLDELLPEDHRTHPPAKRTWRGSTVAGRRCHIESRPGVVGEGGLELSLVGCWIVLLRSLGAL